MITDLESSLHLSLLPLFFLSRDDQASTSLLSPSLGKGISVSEDSVFSPDKPAPTKEQVRISAEMNVSSAFAVRGSYRETAGGCPDSSLVTLLMLSLFENERCHVFVWVIPGIAMTLRATMLEK